jgi:hypothetical protein
LIVLAHGNNSPWLDMIHIILIPSQPVYALITAVYQEKKQQIPINSL